MCDGMLLDKCMEATTNPTTGSKLYIDGTTITVTGTHDYERRGCRYYCVDGINSLGQEVSKIYRTVWL